MKALLVIDMQKGSFTEATPRHDTEGVVERINLLSSEFRKADLPVIFIQHDGSKHGEFVPGTTDWEILDELIVEESDFRINKYINDCFYQSELRETLDNLTAEELVVTGCATDFCVEATIQSALIKDYSVTVVSDGHTTGNRPHLSAEKVIEHYNWVWRGMIPAKGHVKVENAISVLSKM